jgi:restriction endonuclease
MEDRDEHGQPTGEQLLYLVRETKATTNLYELRPDEHGKVLCGERHFRELGVDCKIVACARQLP